MPELATRAQARAAGATRYFTGKPCPQGHIAERIVSSKVCVDCNRERAAAHREANPDAFRNWRDKNLERDRSNSRDWQRNNRNRVRVLVAERTAARKNRTPPWCDTAAVRAFYEIAARVSACTGIRFSVDHIEPLRGKRASGLHVPWNLRVMPLRANIAKGNRA